MLRKTMHGHTWAHGITVSTGKEPRTTTANPRCGGKRRRSNQIIMAIARDVTDQGDALPEAASRCDLRDLKRSEHLNELGLNRVLIVFGEHLSWPLTDDPCPPNQRILTAVLGGVSDDLWGAIPV